jgi:magnesium-transporting ATPase (P-type)
MYRGTRLKNTKWIYGLAFLTGRNTKIIMNSKSESNKMSQIEVKVNYILVGILIAQTVLSIICGIAYGVFRRLFRNEFQYINWPTYSSSEAYDVGIDSFLVCLSYLVLLNTMIPISLIVSIEIVKFFQMIFIQKDKLLYSNYRKRGVTVKSASLNEELGQIEYIFSDKTGTLTMNIMQFKIALIGTQMYGDISLIAPDRSHRKKEKESDEEKLAGFKDDKLKELLETGAGDRRLDRPLSIKNS